MTNEAPLYISLSEAARRLGYANSSSLRLWSSQGRIPGAIKIGSQWTLPIAWVEEQEKTGKPVGPGGPRGKGVRGKKKKEE